MRNNSVMVLYLGSKGAGPGFCYSLARELESSSLLEAIVCAKNQELMSKYVAEFQDKVFPVESANTLGQVSNIFRLFRCMRVILNLVKKKRVRNVLCPMTHPWVLIALPLLKVLGCNISFVIHDAIPHPGDSKIFNLIQRFILYFFAKSLIFVSDTQKKYMDESVLLRKKEHYVIKHPSFFHYFDFKSYFYQKSKPEFDFVFFGRIEPYKGLNLLISAYKRLLSVHPDATLLMCGSGEVESLDLDAIPGVSIDLRYIPDSEVPSIICKGKVVVLPYLCGTQSGVMTIANDFNRLCVSTPVEGLIEQGKYTGVNIFSENFSEESLAIAMASALKFTGEVKNKWIHSGVANYFDSKSQRNA
jgi:glycosyltransferase involved in cell wall biosynthesis